MVYCSQADGRQRQEPYVSNATPHTHTHTYMLSHTRLNDWLTAAAFLARVCVSTDYDRFLCGVVRSIAETQRCG
jgi:hypothetical protein